MDQQEFTRQPRFLSEMPSGEKEIESPPSMPQKPEISWLAILLPPLVMIAITLVMALTRQSGIYMLMSLGMTGVTLITSLTAVARQKKKYRTGKEQRETKYLQYITDIKTELTMQHNMQIVGMTEMNPEPQVCMNRIRNLDSKLWERTTAHADFLSVRVGIGNVPFAVKLNYQKQRFNLEEDPLIGEPQKVGLEFEKVNNVPVCMDLWNGEICGVVGEDSRVIDLLNALMLQVVTNHGYDDVNIVLLLREETKEKLDWLRFVPQIWGPDNKIRFMACGNAMAHQTLAVLYDMLRSRELNKKDNTRTTPIMLPHFVFVVDDHTLLEKEPIAKYLHNPNKEIGVSTVFVAKNKAYLPTNCRIVLHTGAKAHEITNKDDGSKIIFSPDTVDASKLDFIGRRLAPVRIKSTSTNFMLPNSITLTEMYKIKTVEEIDLRTRWLENRTYMGMSVPIGARAGGELFFLDMHETGFGPHGLVAGTTGSGKSELLQSIIISLSMNYHPHDVVFVLIDYKGGGMADVFQGMPHLVGTITNLGGNQTTRALISIKSELQRRQRLFSDHGVNNIDKYQKLYHNGGASTPIPHLIMIADEFAELKAEQPDFMKELVSTARVGRSLGVHLILATQKPGGIVDDQIWSNSKFKISLKVQDVSDSRDVIKRDDAAYIKEPGRAYIQVGNDEIFEMFQSAYAGADYDPGNEKGKSENKEKSIYKVDLNGRCEKIFPMFEEKIAKTELPSQLSAMVKRINETAKEMSIEPLPGPWPPPLSEKLFLDELFVDGVGFNYETGVWRPSRGISPVVGIFDNPRDQIQAPLAFDFLSDGNLFVYGMAGSGKTVFLQTLCMSLAHHYTPQEVCLYVLDFGGGTFRRMESLPHIGGLMTLDEEIKINQFLVFIFRLIEERKQIFVAKRVDGFAQYKEKYCDEMPAVFVIVDNYTALSELYDSVADQILVLAREGLKYGIYMVASANTDRAYRFSINFKMAVAFEMTEKGDYDAVVGRCNGLEPSHVLGRALLRNKPPLEFQTANCRFTDKTMEEVLDVFEGYVKSGKIKRAMPIPQMPEIIDIDQINTVQSETQINIALKADDLRPAGVDLMTSHVFLVTGDVASGKSTALASMTNCLLKTNRVKVYIKDSMAAGLFQVMGQENVTSLDELEDEYAFAQEINDLLDRRRAEFNECRKSGEDPAALKANWEMILFVFDNITEYADSVPSPIEDLIVRIAKKEAGMKVSLLAAGNLSDVGSAYGSVARVFKEMQNGLLFGSLKEQGLFNARMPYGSYEKQEFGVGEGYLINRNRFSEVKVAVDTSLV